LGTCGFLIQEPVSQTTACMFHSNQHVWNWHDHFYFPSMDRIDMTTGGLKTPPYQGFTVWKKGAQAKPGYAFNKVVIEYDRKNQEFRWYVNDKLTKRNTAPGAFPDVDGTLTSKYIVGEGADTSKKDLPGLQVL